MIRETFASDESSVNHRSRAGRFTQTRSVFSRFLTFFSAVFKRCVTGSLRCEFLVKYLQKHVRKHESVFMRRNVLYESLKTEQIWKFGSKRGFIFDVDFCLFTSVFSPKINVVSSSSKSDFLWIMFEKWREWQYLDQDKSWCGAGKELVNNFDSSFVKIWTHLDKDVNLWFLLPTFSLRFSFLWNMSKRWC